MLTMLSAVVIAATALAMALLCGALVFPLPSGQARNPRDLSIFCVDSP